MVEIKEKTLYELIENSCKKYSNDIALVYDNYQIDYNTLLDNINIIARSLKQTGISNNSKINVCLGNKLDAVYLLFALNKIGTTINYINYDLDNNYINENIDDNILIIDDENYSKYKEIIDKKEIEKIIITGNNNYKSKKIINWETFIDISKNYNSEIKREYKSSFIPLINTYKNKLCEIVNIHISEEALNNSIINILNSNIKFKNKTLLNVNQLYNYIGYNISLIVPLILGCKVILGTKDDINDLIKEHKPNYIIGEEELIYKIARLGLNIKSFEKVLVISDIIDEHRDSIISDYFNGINKCKIYKTYGLNEINNVIGLNMDTDINIVDVISNKRINDDEIGKILIKSNSYCKNYKNGKLVKLNKNGYYETQYVGKMDDNSLYIIDTKDKEVVRNSMRRTKLASVDMPWLKYYPEESKNDEVAKLTLYENLREANKDNYLETALIYMNEEIKFYELFNNIEIVAKSLKALGIKKGDYVTLCMPNIPEFVYIFYALNKIGAISCLIEPRTPANRIKGYLEESKSKFMFMVDLCKNNIDKIIDCDLIKTVVSISPIESITSRKIKSVYNLTHKKIKYSGKYITYKEFIKMGSSFENIKTEKYKECTTATVVYTSGTTGKPKGAMLPNETYNGQNMQLKYSGICPKVGERFLGNIPFFSAYGSSSGMHNALSSGVTIILIPSYKPTDFPKLLYKNRPTHVMGVPRFFEILASSNLIKKDKLDFLKNPISGGDKMTPNREYQVNDRLLDADGVKLKKGLGMSEFGGGFITTVNEEINKVGSVGIPHVGNNVKIVDPKTHEEIEYGRDHNVGELYVTSPTVMNGYLNNKEETDKFFEVDENGIKWAKTGDLVYMDEDGAVFFIDRIKNVIMRPDGHTVPLLPIENALDKSEYVVSCAVVGVDVSDKHTGKMPMAYIVLNKDRDKSVNEIHNELKKLVNTLVPIREQPKWYRYVDKLPYNLGGKVDVKKLESIGAEDKNKNEEFVNLEKNNKKE